MKRLLLPALALIALPLAGCVYRMDVPQGNYVEQKQVSLLRVGMTREQVRYVLGSPITENPFRADEWDYIYVERHGWDDPIQKNLFLTFTSDGRLSSMRGDFEKPSTFSTPLQPGRADLHLRGRRHPVRALPVQRRRRSVLLRELTRIKMRMV